MKIYTQKTVLMTETPGEYIPVSETSYEYDGPLALADRIDQNAARTAATGAGTTAAGFGAQATGINSFLNPKLQQEAENPTGFNPVDLNNMFAASAQGAGGANAGVTGQANLESARTRNSGGFSSALDSAARSKQQSLSENALGVQNQNAELKQKQQQAGLSGLESQSGMDVNAQLKAMGLQTGDIDAATKAQGPGAFKDILGAVGAASSFIKPR